MRVDLRPDTKGPRWALLRPLTGRDELALDVDRPGTGTELAGRLLVSAPGAAVASESFRALAVGDRDRILAAIYRCCFGERIEGAGRCASCSRAYEFDCTLGQLFEYVTSGAPSDIIGPDADGYYALPDGARFRLPRIEDIEAVASLPIDEATNALFERCAAARGAETADRERIQSAMERVAPALSLDFRSVCPHCNAEQTVPFDLESHLVRSLARERRFLTLEIHRVAAAYGWSLDEILSLSREDRHSLVRHIEAEPKRGRG